VSSIKYGKMKIKKRATSPARRGGRAKLSGSEAIRRLLAKKPDSGPKAIRETLARKGITVSPGLVSFVKFNFKKGGRSQAAKTPAVRAAVRKTAAPQISFEQLIEVKKVSAALGGADQLRQALDMLAQLS
jgi:hypothetical protein